MNSSLEESPLVSLAAWVFLLLGLASAIHWVTGGLDSAASGRPVMSAAYGWWVALGFVFLQIGIGRRIGRLAVGEVLYRDGVVERLASFTVGFWISSVVLMILAAAGLLNGLGVMLYVIAALAFGVDLKSLAWPEFRRRLLPDTRGRELVGLLLLVAIGIAVLPYFLQTMIPNTDADGASTHLPLALWFQTRGLQAVPLEFSNLIIPGNVHLVYGLFLGLGAEQAIIPLNLIVSLLTCVAAGAMARHFWGKTAGWWALGVALSTNLILELGLDPRIDGFLAFFCTIAAFGIMVWILEEREPGALMLSGAALGCALGTKYTAIFPLVLWGLPLVWVGLSDLRLGRHTHWRAVSMVIACAVIPSTYWYLSNTVSFGDPLYPRIGGEVTTSADGRLVPLDKAVGELLKQTERNDAFEDIFNETLARQSSYQPPSSLFGLRSVFLAPERHSRKPGHTLSPLLLLFVLLPVFQRDRSSWLLMWMGLSAFLVIGSQAYLIRYGLVFYPVMAVGAGAVLGSVQRRWWRMGWAVVLLFLLVVNLSFEWRQIGRQRVVAWLSAGENRVEWLRQVGYNGSTGMPEMIQQIFVGREDGSIPTEGKIFMVGEAKFHLLGFQALPDISRTGLPWLAYLARHGGDLEAVHQELWSDGVRYLLVSLGYFGWVRGNLTVDAEQYAYSMATLREFVESNGQVASSTSGIILFRLNPVNKS